MDLYILIGLTLAEFIIIFLVLLFFKRLRRSEQALEHLQSNQEEFMDRLLRNVQLEQEMVTTFIQRQEQLERLNIAMEERIYYLKNLIKQAEDISHSPYLMREIIMNSKKKGLPLDMIAKKTGMAKDEIEIILKKENLL